MAGLMEFAQTPDFWNWASGVAGGLTRAGQGRGYDISQANQQLFQGFKDRSQMEQMRGLMDQGDYTPQQRGLMDSIRDPRMLQQMLMQQAFPQQGKRQLVKAADGFQYDVNTGERAFPGVEMAASEGASPAVWQQKRDAMIAGGMDADTATNIATGRWVTSRNPISGQADIIDKATGRKIGEAAPAEEAAPAPTTVPADVSYGAALGGEGLISGMANTVADAIGMDLPAPQAERASQALKNLQTRTATILQSSIPGRPSNYLMQQFEGLTVTPGSLFQGEQRSKERLGQTRDLIRRAIDDANAVISNSGSFQPSQVAEARQSKIAFEGLLRDYEIILERLGPSQEGASGPPPEGTIRKNYETGEEIIWNGSAWVPHG